jgi:hypothetical protein
MKKDPPHTPRAKLKLLNIKIMILVEWGNNLFKQRAAGCRLKAADGHVTD